MNHRTLEHKALLFTVLTAIALLVGSIVELVPMWVIDSNVPTIASVKPYTPLELYGRHLYLREGCYNCHSQMVRPFRFETERYGTYSKAGEFVYDHPFQWGSKRTGPDLHRVGGKYSDDWHYHHLLDPRDTSVGSIMPSYAFLAEATFDAGDIPAHMRAMARVGVPYTEAEIQGAPEAARAQAEAISARLKEKGITCPPDREIVALIAYLQRLGTDIENAPAPETESGAGGGA